MSTRGFGERLAEFIRGIQSEKERYKELASRTTAELENYKREAARQAQQRERIGAERVILALLPALEHMDRALDYAGDEPDPEALKQGIEMIRSQIMESLEFAGLQPIQPQPGQGFDPSLMEAAEAKDAPDAEPGTVLQVLSVGYSFKGKLLKPARVVVCGKTPIKEAEKR